MTSIPIKVETRLIYDVFSNNDDLRFVLMEAIV